AWSGATKSRRSPASASGEPRRRPPGRRSEEEVCMPTRHTTKGTPVVQFDPQLEVPPYTIFRRLKEGDPPLLIDVRPVGGRLALMGARGLPGPDWTPPPELDVVLVDDDGATAVEIARRLQAAGFP